MYRKPTTVGLLLSLVVLTVRDVAGGMHSWDPYISHECYSEYKRPSTGPVGPNCSATAPFPERVWLVGTTNEDFRFGNGSINDFPLTSPILVNDWQQSDPAYPQRHQVTFGVNKLGGEFYWHQYSFAGLTDSWDGNPETAPPSLKGEVQVVFQATLRQWAVNAANPNTPKIRAMVGTTARWNGVSHFVEVNLGRSDSFRLCTNTEQIGTCCAPPHCPWGAVCDPTDNLYDRRFDCGPTGAKGVYYHGPAVGQPELVLNTPANFSVDMGQLFRSYPWSDYPADWTNITLAGIYLGAEVWSEGVAAVEFANYFTWTPN